MSELIFSKFYSDSIMYSAENQNYQSDLKKAITLVVVGRFPFWQIDMLQIATICATFEFG